MIFVSETCIMESQPTKFGQAPKARGRIFTSNSHDAKDESLSCIAGSPSIVAILMGRRMINHCIAVFTNAGT